MNDFERLGNALRHTQDEALSERDDLERVRERLLAEPHGHRKASKRAAGIVAGLAAAAVLLFVLWPAPRPLAFQVDEAPGTPREWMSSPAHEDLPLRFSDGSSLLLRAKTRARVQHTDARGANVQLERGEAAVSVVHRNDTRWTIEAGPYRVHVIGTRFDVAYAPDSQTFSLDLHDGSVRIEGPGVSGRVLVAGQKVRLQAAKPVESEAAAQPLPAVPPAAPTETTTESNPASEPAQATAPSPTPVEAGPQPDWRVLARKGQYAAAVRLARTQGVTGVIKERTLAEVMLLADAAFYARDDELANTAYIAVRSRAARQAEAAAAAFSLGRLSMERGGSLRAAAQWFETYLREAPEGPLAREALGRLCEAQQKGADPAARSSAQLYLERYPDGPHARVARAILTVPMR